VNAYALADGDKVTLVDCGLSDPALDEKGWAEVVASLAASGLRVEDVDRLIVTHPHVDHYGMAGRVKRETGAEVVMHVYADEDLDVYRDPAGFAASLRDLYADHGVDESDLDELAAFEDWRGYISGLVGADKAVAGGESLRIGDRNWQVIYTPGHSRSHICLCSDDGILISGDHLLPGITPHIDFHRGGDEDPLGEFIHSLEVIEDLDPRLVLPGHGKPFDEGAERARAIARHHDRRLGSILQVIRKTPRTASEITEEVFGSTLLNFERRLALGEALAHLAYLRVRGEVERFTDEDGKFRYRKVSRRRPDQDER
jgi:glyoxylase-like metal-dependent hydrolase (beta-lactamase superfamily II)